MGGVVGSIFGGGGSKTTVNQAATNHTDVTVTSQIANIIDVSVIAEAIKAAGQQTSDLIAQLAKIQIVAQLADAKAQMDQNEIVKKALKYTGISAVLYFVWRQFYG